MTFFFFVVILLLIKKKRKKAPAGKAQILTGPIIAEGAPQVKTNSSASFFPYKTGRQATQTKDLGKQCGEHKMERASATGAARNRLTR